MEIAVLHVVNGSIYGGAERVQEVVAVEAGLDKEVRVDFFALSHGEFVGKAKGLSFKSTGRSNIIGVLVELFLIARDYDIVHCHTPKALLAVALVSWFSRRKIFYHVHSPTIRCTNRRLRNLVYFGVERMCRSRVAEFVAVSRAMRSYVLDEIGAKRCAVVYNGVADLDVRPSSERARFVNGRIAMVALFRERKGLEDLVDAVGLSVARGEGAENIRVDLIGPFESRAYEMHVREKIEAKGLSANFDFLGFSREPLVHGDYKYLVLPSRRGEGLPMVLIESLRAGIPILCSSVDGNLEVVKDSLNGFKFAASDAKDLSRVLNSAMALSFEEWKRLSIAARSDYMERFRSQKMWGSLKKLYLS